MLHILCDASFVHLYSDQGVYQNVPKKDILGKKGWVGGMVGATSRIPVWLLHTAVQHIFL